MARFPTRDADVAALAGTMVFGLAEHAEDFPDSPVSVERLQEALDRFNRAKETAAAAEGAVAEAYEEKGDATQVLTDYTVLWSLAVVSLLTAVAVALFIERVLEVFLTSWRSHRTAELKERAAHARSKSSKHQARLPDEDVFRQYQSQTQRIAFCGGTTLGVIVAAARMHCIAW